MTIWEPGVFCEIWATPSELRVQSLVSITMLVQISLEA